MNTNWLANAVRSFLVFAVLIVTSVFYAEVSNVDRVFEHDIVVYGGTSGGVTAAVQSARMGKSVVVVSPTEHLGGLTSSGLGWTDLGDSSILGGISREFYHRLYRHYNDDEAWVWESRADYGNRGQGGPAFNHTREIASVFEPSVAERIFVEMLDEHRIPVHAGRLDLVSGVVMDGNRIVAIRTEDGHEFRGGMFIDASYEGDILPGAGVSYTTGRESNNTYNETINGIQAGMATKNQLPNGIDPYVVPGVPRSGLLPGVNSGPGGPDGSADHRFQAYCYRMVLTDVAENRLMIEQPEGYDEANYELLFRAIEAGQSRGFFKFDLMPNRKTDSNNTGGISTDYIGKNYGSDWNWATLNHDERDALAKEHENWQRGLVWTLQNHPRVPSGIRVHHERWGLPLDEFTDNNHWPYQIYVREARRMVSDYVMTQQHCSGMEIAPESVGMGAYPMDSHNTQRHLRNGMVKNEGDVQVNLPGPYPISYRSIVPKSGECENLLVPWSLSASHMAFGSIRMEPVFMTLAQSAATAAVLALDGEISVQEVPYEKLEVVLRADGQALTPGESGTIDFERGIVVDSEDPAGGATVIGKWQESISVDGFHGENYLHDDNQGKGHKSVRFAPDLPESGKYDVYLIWTEHQNRADNVPVRIHHKGGTFSTSVNQRENGGSWQRIGTFPFTAGSAGELLLETTDTNGFVIADAVLWLPLTPTVGVVSPVPTIVRGSQKQGTLVFTRSGSVDDALDVHYRVTASEFDTELLSLTGTFTIPAGERDAKLAVSADRGPIPNGFKLVEVLIKESEDYRIGSLASATLRLRDEPFDEWRYNHFTTDELKDHEISGPMADPDGDGLVNLFEFFFGGNPKVPEAKNRVALREEAGLLFGFRRHREAADLIFQVEESVDLKDWKRISADIFGKQVKLEGDFHVIDVPVDHRNCNGNQRFFRLQVKSQGL